MSSNRGQRFSNDKYLTRNQVAKEMGSTLIENIWHEVLEYRAFFQQFLALRTVEKNKLRVVYTPRINEKVATLERKLTNIYSQVAKIKQRPDLFSELHFKLIKEVLTSVAAKYNIAINDGLIKQFINGSLSALSPSELLLDNYYKALFMYRGVASGPLDVNLLARFAEYFNEVPLDNYIYRRTEIKAQSEVVLIGRLYLHVPVNQIPEMVEDLMGFIQGSTAQPFVKFATILFFMIYIKPFEVYSEEIALLFAKAYLANSDLDILAPYLNFEEIIGGLSEKADEVMNEVKRTNDITYFIDFLADYSFELLKHIEEKIMQMRVQILKMEQVGETPLHDTLKPGPQKTNLFDFIEEEPLPDYIPMPKAEEKESSETLTKQEEPSPLTALQTVPDLAISGFPAELAENDARKLEKHLRETNPSLSKSEAYFFARHCTLGKYYTIRQFKEVLGCAYETARTSMDHLAKSGYYRKEKLKNKFIYTPNKIE